MKKTLNIILQGKGGVGKSLIAKILAEYFLERDCASQNADTDPVNKTFAKVKSLNVTPIELIKDQVVSQQMFDSMVDLIITNKNNNFVIDNGSSCFLPLIKYINDNDFLELLEEQSINLIIHTVLAGGANEDDCLGGLVTLQQLIENAKIKNKNIISLWLNPFFGSFKSLDDANKPFFDVSSINNIYLLNQSFNDAFVTDFSFINDNRLTHVDALKDPNISFMSKRRIDSFYKSIFIQLDNFYLSNVKAKKNQEV